MTIVSAETDRCHNVCELILIGLLAGVQCLVSMKRIWLLAVFAAILASVTVANTARSATAFSFQVFYDSLSPYGRWVKDLQYGFVWIPAVENNFHPYYSHGYWAMTQYGNTWISAYSWGWAAFHYGCWTYDDFYGWIWIPGQYWSPACVSWRKDNRSYGWAPLAPNKEATDTDESKCPRNWWVFVPATLIHDPHFHPNAYGHSKRMRAFRRSKAITCSNNAQNHYSVCAGPDVETIQRQTGQGVKVWALLQNIHPATAVAMNSSITLFHPEKIVKLQNEAPSVFMTAPQPISRPVALPRRSFDEAIRDSYGHPQENFDTVKYRMFAQPGSYIQK